MAPLLIAHVSAGSVGILSGAATLAVRKGGRWHRRWGTVFVLSMLAMAALGVMLALFLPPGVHTATPPAASAVAGGALTFYLFCTAWMTVKRRRIGLPEYAALLIVAGLALVLLTLGLLAAHGHRPTAAPYFVFGTFAVFAAALDIKVILRGGISGTARIARHLWRMCVALFFAAASLFIGQQKVMPAAWHGSPLLYGLALAPLMVMVYWLVRVRRPVARA